MNQPLPDQPIPKISILILAGGRATRMHGVDKGLVQLHGQTLVERIYRQVSAFSDDILISANRNQDTYQKLLPDCQIISDEWSDFRGPLAGIYSGLKHSKYNYLWVIPCDLMMLPEHCLQQLWQTLLSTDSHVVYAALNDRALYPLCLLHADVEGHLQNSLLNNLDQQQFAVRHWLFKHNAELVNFNMTHESPLNLNTLQDVGLVEQCYSITTNLSTTPLTSGVIS